jgi:hypothetical protein
MKETFFAKLDGLVAAAKNFLQVGFGNVSPEEATKQHLIEPLLAALGYTSPDRLAREYKILGDEVDYLLKSDRPLLFLEAKSLHDPAPSLFEAHREQIQRYIRNYRISPQQARMDPPVNWIVLTNFAQFHFIRVNEETPTFSFQLSELVTRREELWDLLALENVEANRIEELYDQHQKADLDKRFLADLKRWRLIIANGFALKNPSRSLAELTRASQQLLDRFLFCRMLETHRLIEYNQLARAFSHYTELYGDPPTKPFSEVLKESLFAAIKRDFNTELFVRPQLCDELAIDNLALAVVIGHEPLGPEVAAQCQIELGQAELVPFKHLYGYDFSRMSQDIMGAVYERFLAHKLLQADGRIVIEDTDELRKKEGIYYTPRYIVDYIVEHTVGEKIKPILNEALTLLGYKNYLAAARKIRELATIRVLDPAMGSGSFLLRAFDALARAYADYNAECRNHKRARNHTGMLFDASQEIAEEIDHVGIKVASENIFGVDLDEQAVEVAKLNLWIRLMAAERDFIRDRLRRTYNGSKPLNLLPTLANNLKCGNSLIADPAVAGPSAFDWQKEFSETMTRGGFDCVIGNPPYVVLQDEFRDDAQLAFFRAHFAVASYKIDTYHLFIEQGIKLAIPGGFCAMITPANFLTNNFLARLRRHLIQHAQIDHVLVIDGGVFDGVSVDSAIFVVRAAGAATSSFPIRHARPEAGGLLRLSEIAVSPATALADAHVLFTGEATASLKAVLDRVLAQATPLGQIADVNFGKQLRDREKFDKDVISTVGQKMPSAGYKPCYTGEDVTRYHVCWSGLACLDSEEARCGGCWDPIKQNAVKKLLTRQIGLFPEFAFDARGYQCLNTIFMVNVRQEACDPLLLLGALNSTLLRAFWLCRFYDQRRTFPKIKGSYLEELPIRLPKSSDENATARKIAKLVGKMLKLREQHHDLPIVLRRKLAHTANRTPCSLAHYLPKDFTGAVAHETLIDDVQRQGFVHAVQVEAEGKTVTVSATVAEDAKAEPHALPLVRLTFKNEALRQFVYAGWKQFLADHARKKKWTTGRKPDLVYQLVVNTIEPLVYFQSHAGDNLRTIRDLMKAVADEAGTADLSALEAEIATTDREIDERVYALYGLTAEEIKLVEEVAHRKSTERHAGERRSR